MGFDVDLSPIDAALESPMQSKTFDVLARDEGCPAALLMIGMRRWYCWRCQRALSTWRPWAPQVMGQK